MAMLLLPVLKMYLGKVKLYFYSQVYSHSNQKFFSVDFDTFWFCFGGKRTQITQVSYLILKVIKLTFSYDKWCQLNLSGCTWADGTIQHIYKKKESSCFKYSLYWQTLSLHPPPNWKSLVQAKLVPLLVLTRYFLIMVCSCSSSLFTVKWYDMLNADR